MGMQNRMASQLRHKTKRKGVSAQKVMEIFQSGRDIIGIGLYPISRKKHHAEVGGNRVGPPNVISRTQAMVIAHLSGGFHDPINRLKGLFFYILNRRDIRFFSPGEGIIPKSQVRNRSPGLRPIIGNGIFFVIFKEVKVVFLFTGRTKQFRRSPKHFIPTVVVAITSGRNARRVGESHLGVGGDPTPCPFGGYTTKLSIGG